MKNIFKNLLNRGNNDKQETNEVTELQVTELQEFTQKMKQRMVTEGLSYEDLVNINLNSVLAPVKEEIDRLEDNIKILESRAKSDYHSIYPYVKRRREIIEAKTKRLKQLESDYRVSPDLYGCAKSLDNLADHNKGIGLLFQVNNEIQTLYDKLLNAVKYLGSADGYVSPDILEAHNSFGRVVNNVTTNTRRMDYKDKTELESRYFKALLRDDRIFKQKMYVLDSVKEYATILDEPTEAISRDDMAKYEREWLQVQTILAADNKNKRKK